MLNKEECWLANLRGLWCFIALFALFSLNVSVAVAEDTLCASVKIRIEQDLTLNRQGFDAELIVHNGLPETPITDVAVAIRFYDQEMNPVVASRDPEATNALFFLQDPTLSGIDQLPDGNIPGATDAEIHWLIIPTLDAVTNAADYANPLGTLFYVGATFSYKISGVAHQTTVDNDYIYVKPMPELRLDYFLPGDVYGDDPLTTSEVEPVIPFSLGLRVKNIGHGWARSLAIESGQPRIVDNAQGLLVGYTIDGTEVEGVTHPDTLQVAFEDLAPEGDASVARWIMSCSLSGTFTNFNAYLSHADELGGTLTSLIAESNVVSHLLRHDVIVDTEGADSVRDFLTIGDMVYESDGGEFAVSNVSDLATITPTGTDQYTVSFSEPITGPLYARVTTAAVQGMRIASVVRSDGKVLSEHNAWTASTRDGDTTTYHMDIFDCTGSNSSYLVTVEAATLNLPPVLVLIGDRSAYIGKPVSFTVDASDPDGVIPALSADSLPVGAEFIDNGDGSGSFAWTPVSGQNDSYRLRFVASDGQLEDCQRMSVTIVSCDFIYGPAWWVTRGVLDGFAVTTNDFAAVNQGQLKWMAFQAATELESTWPAGAGSNVWTVIDSFNEADNYRAANIGQLKTVAAPFYNRMGLPMPWADASETNNFAVGNVGQLKNLFSFDPQEESM